MLVKVKSDVGGPIMLPYTQGNSTNAPSMFMVVDGWNEIPQEIWPQMETSMEDGVQSGKFEYRCKTIEEEYEVVGADGKKETKKREIRVQQGLQDVRADMARTIIKECYNYNNLKAWSVDPKLTSELRALADIALQEIDKVGE